MAKGSKKTSLKTKVRQLKNKGLSVANIAKELNCKVANVYYHLKHNYKIWTGSNPEHPYSIKGCSFRCTKKGNPRSLTRKTTNSKSLHDKIRGFHRKRKGDYAVQKYNFTLKDVIERHTESPKCYLTGTEIDIRDTRNYQFDHIIPVSRGGDNSLDNLGICTSAANKAKQDMTPDEFIHLCKQILEHNGYDVAKRDTTA